VTACNSYNWSYQGPLGSFNDVLTAAGTYSHTILNVSGCDSVLTLNLTLNNGVSVAAKAMLYGAFDASTGLMKDSLRQVSHCASAQIGSPGVCPPVNVIPSTRLKWNAFNDVSCYLDADTTIGVISITRPTPVDLFSLNAKAINSSLVSISWSTRTEKNVDHYEVERSYNGGVFENAGNVVSLVNSGTTSNNYSFNDNLFERKGVIYYRIKIVELNGSFHYSHIVSVNLPLLQYVNVYPNPFIEQFTIEIFAKNLENSTVKLLSNDGKLIERKSVILQSGKNKLSFTPLGNIPKGSYLLEVIHGTERNLVPIIKR
jgi:hypothetical protein